LETEAAQPRPQRNKGFTPGIALEQFMRHEVVVNPSLDSPAPPSPAAAKATLGLVRGLSATDTMALVIGNVIGTGVFMKTAVMAQETGSPWMVLAAWVAAGLLSLAGALTYAELGAMLPHAGGPYVYLREAYGGTAAFFYGWMLFVAGGAGSIAILGVGTATFFSAIIPLTTVWAERHFSLLGQTITWRFGTLQLTAVGTILAFAAINCLSVRVVGRVQSVLTAIKVGSIVALALGIFFLSDTGTWTHLATPAGPTTGGGVASFGIAMMAALWAYNGWGGMPMVAGEVRDPARNVPRALAGGMLAVIALYCAANLSYFFALDFDRILSAHSTLHRDAPPVAAVAAQTAFGDAGARFIAVAFIISALGALNSTILTNTRVPFAMARDGVFPEFAARLHPRTRVPASAVSALVGWACVLAVSGTFDQLTDYVVFALWIFYGLIASSVFVLRRKRPAAERPYRTFGYPLLPLLFVGVAIWLVLNTLVHRPVESIAGVLLIGLGWPVHLFFRRRARLRAQAGHPA
jgi:basic amino acid/polyamine antiporter, APA family